MSRLQVISEYTRVGAGGSIETRAEWRTRQDGDKTLRRRAIKAEATNKERV